MTRAASDCTSEHGKNYFDSRLMSDMGILQQLPCLTSAFTDKRQRIPSGFGGCIAPDRKGETLARAAERRPRLHLGCQTQPKPHIRGPRLNNPPCIRPSTLAVHPILSVARGQQLFWCPELSPLLATISGVLLLVAARQVAQLREQPRWRTELWQARLSSI
jgi:hypothetical protein